jgi:hypothetical protein
MANGNRKPALSADKQDTRPGCTLRAVLRPFTRSLITNSTLARSSGSARGNALKNKQPRPQQNTSRATAAPRAAKLLAHSISSARGMQQRTRHRVETQAAPRA